MSPEPISRRQALTQLSKGVFGLGAASFLLPSLSGLLLSGCQSNENAQAFAYDVPQWTGDTFGPMHLIRDDRQPQSPQKPSQHVDVVIVGGGLSGLTVATQLINEDF